MVFRLEDVASPRDLRGRTTDELQSLSSAIRDEIVGTVSKTGGHLASSLGAVEMTLALHTVFDTPKDKIVWDVGHQTYAHKLVTGRSGKFSTVRTLGGLSGYPKRQESDYDVYDTGHASGSVSYALGLAKARDAAGEDFHVVAVIGDGALGSGVAYEGLNNTGGLKTRLIVVVNDNSMSISPSVGGISFYLTVLRLAPFYRSTKKTVGRALERLPSLGRPATDLVRRMKGGLKHFLFPEAWFESLGFRYYGPIDGHDIAVMQKVFEEAKSLDEPVLVHLVTEKGRGYSLAVEDPEKFHGPGPFDPDTGEMVQNGGPPSWNKVFGEAMCEIASNNPKVVAITAAMSDGTGLGDFQNRFPDRFFDVGIAESHAVTFAAGLAQGGLIPVVAIYSTFLQRAYDQIIQDVAQQNLKVVFAIDRAGLVGEDGETHHGEFDLSYLGCIPNLTVMAPKDEAEFVDMLYAAMAIPGSCAVRYPRGSAVGVPYHERLREPRPLTPGKAEVLSEGSDVNLVAVGSMVAPAIGAARILEKDGISCGVVNARFVAPIDLGIFLDLSRKTPLYTIEENVGPGGFGERLAACLATQSEVPANRIRRLCLPFEFVRHGSMAELRRLCRLDEASIAREVKRTYGGGQ